MRAVIDLDLSAISGKSEGRANSMDPLCTSLVHQYLESTNSALTDQFKTKYQPTETNLRLKEVLVKCNIEQLARNIVYQHLRTVAPYLALEFRDTHYCSREMYLRN